MASSWSCAVPQGWVDERLWVDGIEGYGGAQGRRERGPGAAVRERVVHEAGEGHLGGDVGLEDGARCSQREGELDSVGEDGGGARDDALAEGVVGRG